MTEDQTRAETISLLQDLGLKEYEARCFLALTQCSTATAKEISQLSEVPRTRVYDAIRVLEAHGLVEVQHSSPKRFRATAIDEATATLRQQFDTRIDTLRSQLESLDSRESPDEDDQLQEVWSLTGHEGIESRMYDLLENAQSEIVLVVVDEEILTDALFDRLREAAGRDVDILLGGDTETIIERLEAELSAVKVFETDLEWLMGPEGDDEVAIGRLLLVDRNRLLVSSFYPDERGDESHEQAVFANGLQNGVVVLLRRVLSSGLLPVADPAT